MARNSENIAGAISAVNGIVGAQTEALAQIKTTLARKAAGASDISLGITSAAVGDIVKVKAVDASGKPTEWEAHPEVKTRLDMILNYTFAEASTLADAPNLSDYILYNNKKAVWNKDSQGKPLKALRMWGYMTSNEAATLNTTAQVCLFACARASSYESTPSGWWYGDDMGNGGGTARLCDPQHFFTSTNISAMRSSAGFFDIKTMNGVILQSIGNPNWEANLHAGTFPKVVQQMSTPGFYKEYIYAAFLETSKADFVFPKGTTIMILAEVIDE